MLYCEGMMCRFFKRWPLCCCALLMVVTMVCAEVFYTDAFAATPVGMVVRGVLLIIGMLGVGAMLVAPARLLIGLCRKTLAYETHADAVLLLLLECLFFLLANLHM